MPKRAVFVNSESGAEREVGFTSDRLNIDILQEVNRVGTAQLQLLDREIEGEVTNSEFFAPGQAIEILLDPDTEESEAFESVFIGTVVKYAMRAYLNQTFLDITLKDAAVRLTAQRKSRVFQKVKDEEIVAEIVTEYFGTAAGGKQSAVQPEPAETKLEHAEVVQYYCTDWDFILSRAAANGFWVSTSDRTLLMFSPSLKDVGEVPLKFRFPRGTDPVQCAEGIVKETPGSQEGFYNIFEMEMEADIQNQYGSVQSSAWNVKDQEIKQPLEATEQPAGSTGKTVLNSPAWMADLGIEQYDLIAGVDLPAEEIQTWADAKLLKARQSMFRGFVTGSALPSLVLGQVIELTGISELFDGVARVSGIRHQVNTTGWQTHTQLGLTSTWFEQIQDVANPPASGLIPAVSGLQIGVVDQYVADPNNTYRVRVKVPALANATSTDNKLTDKTGGLIWARVACLDAGANRGSVFHPDVGDEVVLGFLHDDPRQAVILGSLHNPKNPAPWEPDEENMLKGVVSRKDLRLQFDDTDDEESITLRTAKGSTIVLADKKNEESILLMDKTGNRFLLNKDGILIDSKKDIKLTAAGEIALTAKKSITLQGASVDVK